jgi:chromosome segregation ATPase
MSSFDTGTACEMPGSGGWCLTSEGCVGACQLAARIRAEADGAPTSAQLRATQEAYAKTQAALSASQAQLTQAKQERAEAEEQRDEARHDLAHAEFRLTQERTRRDHWRVQHDLARAEVASARIEIGHQRALLDQVIADRAALRAAHQNCTTGEPQETSWEEQ